MCHTGSHLKQAEGKPLFLRICIPLTITALHSHALNQQSKLIQCFIGQDICSSYNISILDWWHIFGIKMLKRNWIRFIRSLSGKYLPTFDRQMLDSSGNIRLSQKDESFYHLHSVSCCIKFKISIVSIVQNL